VSGGDIKMKIFLAKIKMAMAIFIPIVALIAFNNCSDVGFEVNEDNILSQLNINSSILINNGDFFTNNEYVILAIHSDTATEMMVSNSSDIETRWEPYKKIKAWQLSKLNSNTEVYVKFKKDGVASTVWVSDDIEHDNIKPVLTTIRKPSEYTNASFSTLQINIFENGSGVRDNFCSLNSSDNQFELCSEGNKLKILKDIVNTNDGPYQYYAYAVDRAGNKSDVERISWVADRTPPKVSFTGELPSLTPNKNSSISFAGSDTTSGISHYLCSWQKSSFSRCESPYIKSGLVDGDYELSVRSIDKAGNQSLIITHKWEVHISAPKINLEQPLPAILSNTTIESIRFSGVDNGFVMNYFECSLNNKAYTKNCKSPYNTGTLSNQKHTIRVRGKDRHGRLSSPATYSWTVDTKINTPTFVKKPKKISNETNANFQVGNIDTDVTKLSCKLNNQGYKNCPTKNSFTFPNLSSGAYILSVFATDKVGNKSGTISYSFTVDNIAPLVNVAGPANNSLATNKDKFTITASDNLTTLNNLKYECKVDNQTSYTPCTKIFEKFLAPDTEHSFTAKVTDEAGNEGFSAPYIYKTVTLSLTANFTKIPEKLNTEEDEIEFRFKADNGGYPLKASSCMLINSNNVKTNVSCQPDQLIKLGKLAVNKKYTFIAKVENNFSQNKNIAYEFEVQKVGECSGSKVCLVIKDDFERSDIRSGEFGWSSFLIDAWSSQGLDISTKSLGEASSGNSAAFFTGRPGGSVHGLFLNSKEINLSGYSSLSIEFDYIMASFESWSYGGKSGLEHFKVDVCTLGEYECGVKPGNTSISKMEDSNRWKTLHENQASSPTNQHLDGNNHTKSDYKNIRGSDLTLNLNNTSLVSDKTKVILRWSFKMDEGIIDEDGNVNYANGTTPDAGILDNIIVKAYKK